jgi:hypothetical protein
MDSAVDVSLGDSLGRGSRTFDFGEALPLCARPQAKRRAQFLLAGVVKPIDLGENVLYSGSHDAEIIAPLVVYGIGYDETTANSKSTQRASPPSPEPMA